MFWIFTGLSVVGYSFFKLGALSVWASVLAIIIQVLIVALLLSVGYILLQHHRKS